ncbi:Hypothetical_protein [Hexamita inflata]|uniref:Hypothetical_protein n=1 Tax=Hexamita inflata TaxID=28002 RepID=A0AA86PSE2_9EUKA|nr:Hypothetical protein HINF_LOCUS31648 [Hexamita inflata]
MLQNVLLSIASCPCVSVQLVVSTMYDSHYQIKSNAIPNRTYYCSQIVSIALQCHYRHNLYQPRLQSESIIKTYQIQPYFRGDISYSSSNSAWYSFTKSQYISSHSIKSCVYGTYGGLMSGYASLSVFYPLLFAKRTKTPPNKRGRCHEKIYEARAMLARLNRTRSTQHFVLLYYRSAGSCYTDLLQLFTISIQLRRISQF